MAISTTPTSMVAASFNNECLLQVNLKHWQRLSKNSKNHESFPSNVFRIRGMAFYCDNRHYKKITTLYKHVTYLYIEIWFTILNSI